MWNVLAACWLRRWNVNRKGKLGLLSYLVCVSRGDNVCRAAVHFFPLFLERMNVWRRTVLIIGWSLLADQKERKKKVWFGRKQKREPFGPRGKVVRPGLRVSRYTVEAINRFFILFGRYNNIPPPRREWSVRSNQESVTDDWYLTVMTKWLMCLSPSTKPGHPLSFPLWFHTHLVLLPCLALSSASDPELMVGRNTSGQWIHLSFATAFQLNPWRHIQLFFNWKGIKIGGYSNIPECFFGRIPDRVMFIPL